MEGHGSGPGTFEWQQPQPLDGEQELFDTCWSGEDTASTSSSTPDDSSYTGRPWIGGMGTWDPSPDPGDGFTVHLGSAERWRQPASPAPPIEEEPASPGKRYKLEPPAKSGPKSEHPAATPRNRGEYVNLNKPCIHHCPHAPDP
jgi:hypothetical protein